ncbi:MAG TPA: DUF4824 family protein [Steroidobacteraceae bacterium]|jgi:hypothetical protein
MKFAWSKSRAMLVAAALVVVTNAIALGGVAYNRSGKPDSVLQLTERELPIQWWSWPENENSAVHLRLNWRIAGGSYVWDRGIDWLSEPQLRALGFELPDAAASSEERLRAAHQTARDVFFALEFDGPAYQGELERQRKVVSKAEEESAAAVEDKAARERVEDEKENLRLEQLNGSRLFVVAVDTDADTLRQRYPDRKHYAIVSGRLELRVSGDKTVAQIDDLNVNVIRVPHAYRKLVEPLRTPESSITQYKSAPRYAATVHFGRRLEPWIVDARRLDR